MLQERFLEKKSHKEKILKSLEEKFQQTEENIKKKKQILDLLDIQVEIYRVFLMILKDFFLRKKMKTKGFWRKWFNWLIR